MSLLVWSVVFLFCLLLFRLCCSRVCRDVRVRDRLRGCAGLHGCIAPPPSPFLLHRSYTCVHLPTYSLDSGPHHPPPVVRGWYTSDSLGVAFPALILFFVSSCVPFTPPFSVSPLFSGCGCRLYESMRYDLGFSYFTGRLPPFSLFLFLLSACLFWASVVLDESGVLCV